MGDELRGIHIEKMFMKNVSCDGIMESVKNNLKTWVKLAWHKDYATLELSKESENRIKNGFHIVTL